MTQILHCPSVVDGTDCMGMWSLELSSDYFAYSLVVHVRSCDVKPPKKINNKTLNTKYVFHELEVVMKITQALKPQMYKSK
jgi:hypothetical protein